MFLAMLAEVLLIFCRIRDKNKNFQKRGIRKKDKPEVLVPSAKHLISNESLSNAAKEVEVLTKVF